MADNIDEGYEIDLMRLLQAAYLYYWGDGETGLTDNEYDALAKRVLGGAHLLNSSYKDLIDWEALKKSSSLYYIPKKRYPRHDPIEKP
jgi:hypothetical protein